MNYRLRPSAAATWVVCPGMVRLSAGAAFDDGDNTVREEGTACHWAAHQASMGHPVTEGTEAPNGIPVDAEMLEAVDTYLQAVAHWPGARFEQGVHCAGIHPECGGTADVGSWDWNTRTLRVGDLKYGYRWVDADSNWQMVCYADGLLRFFGLQLSDVQHVEFMICQPRGGGVQVARMTIADLLPLWEKLRASAIEAMSGTPVCVTNRGCMQCDGRHKCTALQTAALTVLDVSHAATPDALPFPAAENELRVLQWARGIVDARISGLESQIVHGMRAGSISRHFEMRATTSALKWNFESGKQVRAIADLIGVKITKPETLITPTQAKKLLGENLVNMHAQRLQSSPKLVPFDAHKWARIFGQK